VNLDRLGTIGEIMSSAFDLAEWRVRLAEVIDVEPWYWLADSPRSLVLIEHFRDLVAKRHDLGSSVPVDVFTFGKGEPTERYATKVGGLPYRPAKVPWPLDWNGQPRKFLAQFCFADSHDHIRDLPGDVLLIFAKTWWSSLWGTEVLGLYPPEYEDQLVFEWYPVGIDNLISADEIPTTRPFFSDGLPLRTDESGNPIATTPLVIPSFHGVRHRSRDFIDFERAASLFQEVLPRVPDYLEDDDEFQPVVLRGLARYCGTKIGGLPFWYAPPGPEATGRFIASFGGISPGKYAEYPFTNVPGELSDDEADLPEHSLSICPCGTCMNLFLRDDCTIDWQFDADVPW
jgi:hypothetical protein